MKKFLNINFLFILSIVSVFSFVLYVLFFVAIGDREISYKEEQFKKTVNIIQSLKFSLIQESKLLSIELDKYNSVQDIETIHHPSKEFENYSYNEFNIFSYGELPTLTSLIKHTLDDSLSERDTVSKEYSLLYFRSAKLKILLIQDTKELPFVVDDTYFNERCEINKSCTSKLSKYTVSDDVAISPFYIDLMTNKTIFSIASPVYWHDEIIGELVYDIDLSMINNDLQLNSMLYNQTQMTKKMLVVSDSNRLSNQTSSHWFFVTWVALLDNNTAMLYKLDLLNLFIKQFYVFVLVFVILSILAYAGHKHLLLIKEKKYSLRDPLTDVFNRRALSIDYQKYYQTPIALIDGNKVKHINDSHGHHIGDLAIKIIADQLRLINNQNNALYRIGGDEFVLICPGVTESQLHDFLCEVNERLYFSKFSLDYNVTLSISFGITTTTKNMALDLESADKLMYIEKSKSKSKSKSKENVE